MKTFRTTKQTRVWGGTLGSGPINLASSSRHQLLRAIGQVMGRLRQVFPANDLAVMHFLRREGEMNPEKRYNDNDGSQEGLPVK